MTNNFPISVQNQPIFNIKNPERTLRSVLNANITALTFSSSGYNLVTFVVASPGGNPKIVIETSNDGFLWGAVQPIAMTSTPSNLSTGGLNTFISPNGVASYQISTPGKMVRISQAGSTPSHTILNVLLSNGSQASKQQDINIPNNSAFQYAAASGGITNTTAVGIASTAISTSYSYALLSLELTNAGATDTEVLIRSTATIGGGSPTVIFRTFLKAGTSQSFNFKPAIKGTAGQFLEVILSATATVYVNARGTQITS